MLQEQVTVSPVVLKAVLHCTENLSLRSNEDVPSSEYVVTEAANEGKIFQEPVDVGSTINGQVMIIYTETFIPPFNFQISKYALLIFENRSSIHFPVWIWIHRGKNIKVLLTIGLQFLSSKLLT